MTEITDFLIDCGSKLWQFFTTGWFLMSVLAVRFILPKLFHLFRKTMGR